VTSVTDMKRLYYCPLMDCRRVAGAVIAAAAMVVPPSLASAQTFAISRHVVAGGGGTASGESFTVTGTIGQSGVGAPMSGDTYTFNSGFWPVAFAASLFTDEPLVVGVTLARALHVSELRTRVSALRTRFALSAATWTDTSIGLGVTPIRHEHINELRTALAEAYVAAGLSAPVFDDTLIAGVTIVRAVHVSQLRNAVKALEEQ
jgi:hypothetical protein